MATVNTKTLCSKCGKGNGRVRCEGCSKLFCLNDFNGHRQQLGTQLDEIEVTRDIFRQELSDKIAEPQKHTLIQQISQWENKSIDKIRQVAEEARQILIQHTTELNRKLEDRLNKLTNQLRESRQENDFFEPNLNQWREELIQLKDELTKPSNVRIQQDPTALVTKITVKIFDKKFESAEPKPAAADDDIDSFGSDDEEQSEETKKRLAEYAAKKSKKQQVIAKSTIVLDIKPWDDETDLVDMDKAVRSIEADGLVWGQSKLLPLAFGIKKLQIVCVVEDDKIGTDFLEEKICEFEDYVQSVDIVAFNKI